MSAVTARALPLHSFLYTRFYFCLALRDKTLARRMGGKSVRSQLAEGETRGLTHACCPTGMCTEKDGSRNEPPAVWPERAFTAT